MKKKGWGGIQGFSDYSYLLILIGFLPRYLWKQPKGINMRVDRQKNKSTGRGSIIKSYSSSRNEYRKNIG